VVKVINRDLLVALEYKHKHLAMLLLCCAQSQTCTVDTLSALTTIYANIDFVKVYKILIICRTFLESKTLTKNN